MYRPDIKEWLPTTLKEVKQRGWSQLDVILFTGDAYIDHPSFGNAVIGRILENMGLKVAIVAQPNWKDDLRDFKKLGVPRLFFGVSAGVMDSMVNHYTAARRIRSNDAYTAGNQAGYRPDYAVKVYTRILKKLFPEVPVVIGGVEASLRRFTHYDYWQDELKPSMLTMSGADLLIYGMGEKPLKEVVNLLEKGVPFDKITTVRQTSLFVPADKKLPQNKNWTDVYLNSHEDCLKDKKAFAENFKTIEVESNALEGYNRIIQKTGGGNIIVNPPYSFLSSEEIDGIFDLPFTRLPHPKYKKRGAIPAYEMIKFSVNVHRGCFGGCSFCTISAHQGKFISSRSEDSVLKEVRKIAQLPDFKGYLTDLGGPSANMYKMQGRDLDICRKCKRPSCIFPKICFNLNTSHKELTALYKKVNAISEIKKITIGSGIRYDLLSPTHNKKGGSDLDEYIKQLAGHHVSGRLKIAPEHTSDKVLNAMRKPGFDLYYEFAKRFKQYSAEAGLNQQLIPYFISSHPACKDENMAELAVETKSAGLRLEQVQDFTPTPMTLATVTYYSGFDPYSLKPVYTARNKDQKKSQNMFFFWYKNEYRNKIKKRLKEIGREDLSTDLLDKKHMYGKKQY
jgi:uncharacterized radical SAM protein YgiQ